MVIEFRVEVVVEPDGDGFHAYCAALRGLHVGGKTEQEALQNAKDAATAYLYSLIKHGDPIPLGVAVQKQSEGMASRHNVSCHIEDLAVACA
jgi:predicted RNase H-like HicB family nuclease